MLTRLFYSMLAVTTLCGNALLHAVSPETIRVGQGLFEREWPVKDPRLGGDGLGPIFNGQSCVACHNQGGVGGGGAAEFNANTIGIESMNIKGHNVDNDVIASMVSKFHPGFVQLNGSVVNTFTIPHRGGSSGLRHLNDILYQHVPTVRSDFGGSADAAEVRHSYATPILFNYKNDRHEITLRARLFQRNTPSLFGAGIIDAVTDEQLMALTKIQKTHPEISGRPASLTDGRIGKFGWRGNVGSLVEFIDQACANELGLETRRKPQPKDPLNREYRNPTIDITDAQIRAMHDFVSALPVPTRRIPDTSDERAEVSRGEQVFNSVGCAVCHVPNLGVAQGIYSDLLLHEMGYELIDLNHAEPYVVRRTPIVRHDYTASVMTENSPGSMGGYYGATTTIETNAIPINRESFSTANRRQTRKPTRDYKFVAPEYPSRKLNFIDLINEQIGYETEEQVLSDGRRQISEEKLSVHAYIRLHYEPTRFNQEWRTPPLWGVADSAPYMHDGRAQTLLEAITMHDGEAAGTRDRFLNLSLSDRHALIVFLETLVAPSNAPQPRS